MSLKKEAIYAGHLLSLKREHDPQPDSKKVDCCGICDKFYPCLYESIQQLKDWTDNGQKQMDERIKKQIDEENSL